MKRVVLSFQANRLVMIDLWLEKEKEFLAASLGRAYGLDFSFKPEGGVAGALSSIADPARGTRLGGKADVVSYPTVYHLVGQTESVFIGAIVGNTGVRKIMLGDPDTSSTGAFPGKVSGIQIVSRKLENRDGADALK
jgi:hypothetical protein